MGRKEEGREGGVTGGNTPGEILFDEIIHVYQKTFMTICWELSGRPYIFLMNTASPWIHEGHQL